MRRVGQYRENLVRLNTFTAALKRGLTDREAAGIVTDLHFDYGDLSQTERSLRRVFPFYTFTARNTPLQARKVVTRPGKYANLEKLREEAAKAAGLPVGENNDYQRKLKDYEQLGVPIPIPGIKLPAPGGKKTQALAYAGLPVTDLNRITANPSSSSSSRRRWSRASRRWRSYRPTTRSSSATRSTPGRRSPRPTSLASCRSAGRSTSASSTPPTR
jgi:hypothetical protein